VYGLTFEDDTSGGTDRASSGIVLHGEHRDDAVASTRVARIDPTHARVGVRTAHDRGVEQAGHA